MPFGDGTGPRGMGSMTGRGAGYCAGFGRPGFANPIPGRRGFGFRRDYGYPYAYRPPVPYPGYAPFSPQMGKEQELDYLKDLARSMRDDLKAIETRVQEIESKKE